MRIALALASSTLAATALAATPEEAAKLFADKKWKEAAAAYEEVAAANPANPGAWLRLARARAAQGDADGALAALKSGAGTGQLVYQTVMASPELSALHNDARFTALIEPLKPCIAPEFRNFDFWLGDWDVTSPASPGGVSRNRISSINDGCTVLEQYTTPSGYVGTSLNFYDATRKVWHQTWIDNQGGGIFLEGNLVGDSMILSSTDSKENVQRITWTPLADGRVRQHWESTTDSGKTWATQFDGYYSKRPE